MLKVFNNQGNVKAHVIAHNFIPFDDLEGFSSLKKLLENTGNSRLISLSE